MIHYKSSKQIELMRESATIITETLALIAENIKPGITTLQLDKIAEEYIRERDAEPGFLGLYDFPNTLCTSVNEQVVHGIPNDKPLKEGDVVSVDCGVLKNKYYGDVAYTFGLNEISKEVLELMLVTKKALELGIEQAIPGNRVGDISASIQKYCEGHNYGVVRELVGHGLGKKLHEEPQVPNYGFPGRGRRLKRGMTISIEPMINLGSEKIEELEDNWTVVTVDRKVSAHYEQNIAITNGVADVLSDFKIVEEAVYKNPNLVNV